MLPPVFPVYAAASPRRLRSGPPTSPAGDQTPVESGSVRGNLALMIRLRYLVATFLVFFVLGVAPAIAQEEMTGDNAPAVVLEDDEPAVEEDAWTFRYLVPTLAGITGIAILGIALGYTVRIRGRYRVTQ